jgi:hypothetical protein
VSLGPVLVLALGIASMLLIVSRWEHWFDPGWGLIPRLLLFGFAGACSGFLLIYTIGSFLTAIGGIG